MSTATTDGASRQRRRSNYRGARPSSTRRPATKSATALLPRGDGARYALLAGKSLAAAVFVFGALCALIYPSAAPRQTMHAAGEKQKIIARQKTPTADRSTAEAKSAPARLDSALVAKIDLPVKDAPRGDAKILGRTVYGSRVEVLAQDGRWVQVRAIGQNLAGWVEKAGLNF
jgi:hypothetical protein